MMDTTETGTDFSDVHGFEKDSFPDLDQSIFQAFEPFNDKEVHPFYHPPQQLRASAIVKRIEFILKFYHNKSLTDFKRFDFQIYTARSNSLEEQTVYRLLHEDARCFPEIVYSMSKKEQHAYARERVDKYVRSNKSNVRHEKLKELAKRNGDTLYVIVADEAHWGISGKSDDRSVSDGLGAHDYFINQWNHEEFPNVVIIQVSATPYNLLTKKKRLPDVKYVITDDNTWVAVKEIRNKNDGFDSYTNYLKDEVTTKDVSGRVRSLHYFEWSNCLEEEFEHGIIASIQIPQQSGMLWLDIEPMNEGNGLYKLVGTKSVAKRKEFFIKSDGKAFMIFTADKSQKLAVVKDPYTNSSKIVLCSESFECFEDLFDITTFGEDVIGINYHRNDAKRTLLYHDELNEVALGRNPASNEMFPVQDIKYNFILYSWRNAGGTTTNKSYLSLNHYYNSMRMPSQKEKLLKQDVHFHLMCKDNILKYHEPDELLIAEYSMFLLMIPSIRKLIKVLSRETQLTSAHVTEYLIAKKNKFEVFKQKINGLEFLSTDVFNHVCKYYEEENGANDMANLILKIIFSNSESDDPLHVHGILQQEADLNQDFFEAVLSQFETYNIVEDLAIEMNEKTKSLKGSKKIVRVSTTAYGNKLYKTLCIARQVANHCDDGENRVYFELLRDYGNFKLSDCDQALETDDNYSDVEMKKILFRIRLTMQTQSCQYVNKHYETCPCTEYKPKSKKVLECSDCDHVHNELRQYEDLQGLPCLLILVDKGRLGDTFPKSMNTMDLRLGVKGNHIPYLSSTVQELGRLCRYVNKWELSNRDYPYAVLTERLKKQLALSVPMYGAFTKDNHIDPRVKDFGMATRKTHFDHCNDEKHWNRILLKAEPQIGKTGVFLNVIMKLRRYIEGDEDDCEYISETDSVSSDEEDDVTDLRNSDLSQQLSEEDEVVEARRISPLKRRAHVMVSTSESESDQEEKLREKRKKKFEEDIKTHNLEEWKVPYWQDMNKGKVKKRIEKSKYSRIYGAYEYGNIPQKLDVNQRPRITSNKKSACKEYSVEENKYKAFRYDHNETCPGCRQQNGFYSGVYQLQRPSTFVHVSIPKHQRFYPVFQKMGIKIEDQINLCTSGAAFKLESWIFTPTYGRAMNASIMLSHTMIDSNNKSCDYVHILVVREKQYDKYCSLYQNSHCIMKLPYSMAGFENNSETGGIGFARKFIQAVAQNLGLKTIFMLDDNISCIIDITETKQRSNGKLLLHPVPFFKVLNCIEDQMLNNSEVPHLQKVPYTSNDSGELSQLEQYTGPCNRYGIHGIMKFRPGSDRVKDPFKKSHVSSFLGLNVKALLGKSITYKEYSCFEDLDVNNQCDEKGLWVCKNSRYQMIKRNLKSWLPLMFTWNEDTKLSLQTNILQSITFADEISIALQWVKENVRPSKINDYFLKCNRNWNEMLAKAKGMARLNTRNQLTLINRSLNGNPSKLWDHKLDFLNHIFIIEAIVCRNMNMLSYGDVYNFMSKYFEADFVMMLLSTHNVKDYDIGFVLIYVHGKAKNITDELKEDIEEMETDKIELNKTDLLSCIKGHKNEEYLSISEIHEAKVNKIVIIFGKVVTVKEDVSETHAGYKRSIYVADNLSSHDVIKVVLIKDLAKNPPTTGSYISMNGVVKIFEDKKYVLASPSSKLKKVPSESVPILIRKVWEEICIIEEDKKVDVDDPSQLELDQRGHTVNWEYVDADIYKSYPKRNCQLKAEHDKKDEHEKATNITDELRGDIKEMETDKLIDCPHCPTRLEGKDRLILHIRDRHGPRVTCGECDHSESPNRLYHLHQHKKKVHGPNKRTKAKLGPTPKFQLDDKEIMDVHHQEVKIPHGIPTRPKFPPPELHTEGSVDTYKWMATDPRTVFAGAPSSCYNDPVSSMLQETRRVARLNAAQVSTSVTVPRGYSSIVRTERVELPDGRVYSLTSTWVQDPKITYAKSQGVQVEMSVPEPTPVRKEVDDVTIQCPELI